MPLALGRTTGLRPDSVSPISSGGRVSMRCSILDGTASGFAARRQQLLGMVDNPDEGAYPLVWDSDSTYNGFYRVISATVRRIGPVGLYRGRVDLELERVAGYAMPMFEVVMTAATMNNDHSLNPGSPGGLVAIPGHAREASIPLNTSGSVGAAFQTGNTFATCDEYGVTGSVMYVQPVTNDPPTTWQYYVGPEYFYEGACTIWVDEDPLGNSPHPMVGRQVPQAIGDALSRPLTLSNGLVRVNVSRTSGLFAVGWWDGSGWDVSTFVLGRATSSALDKLIGVRVLRNGPEGATIRLSMANVASASISQTIVDLTLRRGQRWISGRLISNLSSTWYVEPGPGETAASTSLTGGLRRTSNDGQGNRFVLAATAAQSNNTSTGRVQRSGNATSFTFMIGTDLGGTGGWDQEIIDSWIVSITERQRVVAR